MSTQQDAIQHSVVVDAPVDRAFQFFTGALGRWWPLAYTFAGTRFGWPLILAELRRAMAHASAPAEAP
ncbi:hypothetical protein ACLEPN_03360 [Myxococcus sp. 1LA]